MNQKKSALKVRYKFVISKPIIFLLKSLLRSLSIGKENVISNRDS